MIPQEIALKLEDIERELSFLRQKIEGIDLAMEIYTVKLNDFSSMLQCYKDLLVKLA